MPIRFYNTLTHRVEEFAPLDPPRVTMYNCGPTVYDFAHIGNFRAFVFADVLRRFLELTGHEVRQVMNLTDVGHMTEDQLADGGGEDKMQLASRRLKEAKKSGRAEVENPDDPYQVAQYFIDAFLADAKALGLKIAHEYPQRMPRATQHVAGMTRLILRLVEQGHAYVAADGAVYYSVQTFPAYGQLSGNTLDRLRTGAGGRVEASHQSVKRHPADFLLWKPDPSHLMKWDSPWGPGYPGWHIECSAMAMELLGQEVIDIHTGGEDNIFPHHECEIAQTRGVTGRDHFARFWMHTRFLLVDGQKMSKSKGNFFTVRDLLAKGVDPSVIRYELYRGHYRSNMNFTTRGLEDAASAVRRLREAAAKAPTSDDPEPPALRAFVEALSDDLNMAGALGEVFSYLGGGAVNPTVLRRMDEVLHVLEPVAGSDGVDAARLAASLDEARKNKDFARADALRKQLHDAGYDVKTTKDGTQFSKRLT